MPFCVLPSETGRTRRHNNNQPSMNNATTAIENTNLSTLIEGIAHDTGRMQKARHHAIVFLENTLREKSAESQEQFLTNMNRPFFQQLNLQEDSDLAVAVIIGCIEEEASERGATTADASGILRRVIGIIIEDI